MNSLQVLCVLSFIVTCIDADCPFDTTIDRVKPCDGKQGGFYKVVDPDISLRGDDCDAFVNGCFVAMQPIKNATASWIAWKDGTQLDKGSKPMCGFNYNNGEVKVDCPMKKGYKICAKNVKVQNPVKKLLDIWCGMWKMSFTVMLPNGESQCVVGEGRLHKKK